MSGGIRHFLQFADFDRTELDWVFERSRIIKGRFKRYQFYQPLADRTLAMVFEKASTRTRVSFEAGMYQMGGSVIHITTGDSQLGRAEPIEDTARVISRMVDIVMIRTYEQAKLERFAAYSRVPVINGLTNEYHPCQILADIFTFIEHRGPITGSTVAWIGDANNMAYTWLQAAKSLGFRLNVSTPPGYALDPSRATAGELAEARLRLAQSLRAQSKMGEVEGLLKQVMETLATHEAPERLRADAKNELASFYESQGRTEDARRVREGR